MKKETYNIIAEQLKQYKHSDKPEDLTIERILAVIKEELPDFQRIDEHRIGKILNNIVGSSIYYDQLLRKSVTLEAVRIYNSTLSKAPANNLQPLPKATPYEFVGLFNESHSPRKIWEWLLSHYGTPEPKQPLPSVEELAKEMLNVWNVNTFNEVAEYVIDKYSLHPHQWWQDLKEGDKFKWEKEVQKFKKFRTYLEDEDGITYLATTCTPYTPPSAQEIIAKHNLSEVEVRAIREGK